MRLPRNHGWLFRLLPAITVALHRVRLEALLAATPEAGRILRPLCRLLTTHPEGALALPGSKPAPKPRPVKPPPPPPPMSAIAQVCQAIAAQTPEAIWVTSNFPEPPEKPPRWTISR